MAVNTDEFIDEEEEERSPKLGKKWDLRGVHPAVRRRMKVQAALRDLTIPEVVERACVYWLETEALEMT